VTGLEVDDGTQSPRPRAPAAVGARGYARQVPLYRDEGVVLRTQKLGEADRIVTLFTRRNGRVRAVAKGVRRTSSRFGARLEPFHRVDAQLYTGRQLDTITQVETLDPFGAALAGDYPRWTAGTAALEAAERLTAEEREPALRLYLLLVGAVRALATRAHPAGLVLDAFLIRALALAGCAGCGAPGPHRAFAPAAGGSVCPACRPPAAATVTPSALALAVALAGGDWPAAEATPGPARREVTGLVAAHLNWHLERSLRSLPLVERV
jgi:DNA repair protein RecO (recombination protein O)